MATISKDRLKELAANRPTQEFPIPGTEETARLRKLSVAEFREIVRKGKEREKEDADDNMAAAVEFLALAWVDENGKPIVTDEEDRAALESLPLEMLIPLFKEGVKFSGVQQDDEDAEKN